MAETAAELEIRKHSALATSHHSVPFAIETLGPICKIVSDLISEISLRLSERSGEPRESAFLSQKLSIAVQRGNCAALRSTFGKVFWNSSSEGWNLITFGTREFLELESFWNLRVFGT